MAFFQLKQCCRWPRYDLARTVWPGARQIIAAAKSRPKLKRPPQARQALGKPDSSV
jgi:hypothetical protein